MQQIMFRQVFGANIDGPDKVNTLEEAMDKIKILETQVTMLENELSERKIMDGEEDEDEVGEGTTIAIDGRVAGTILLMLCGCTFYGFVSFAMDLSSLIDRTIDKTKDNAKLIGSMHESDPLAPKY